MAIIAKVEKLYFRKYLRRYFRKHLRKESMTIASKYHFFTRTTSPMKVTLYLRRRSITSSPTKGSELHWVRRCGWVLHHGGCACFRRLGKFRHRADCLPNFFKVIDLLQTFEIGVDPHMRGEMNTPGRREMQNCSARKSHANQTNGQSWLIEAITAKIKSQIERSARKRSIIDATVSPRSKTSTKPCKSRRSAHDSLMMYR